MSEKLDYSDAQTGEFKYHCGKCNRWYAESSCPFCYSVSRIMDEANRYNMIDHPSHYTYSDVEVIDAIEAWDLGYHLGNVIKYIARHKHKGRPAQDLKKAKWYLERHIEFLESGEEK